jgi:hypothetical protein
MSDKHLLFAGERIQADSLAANPRLPAVYPLRL